MPNQPRYSRFRRLPGLFRTGDARPPDPHAEPQPLTVYLPGHVLDAAEALAARHGAATVQEYCEDLLRMAIEDEHDAARAESVQLTRSTLDSLDDLADDPDYLADVAGATRAADPDPPAMVPLAPAPEADPARAEVLRHAGLGPDDDPLGFLPTLRRGEAIGEGVAERLLGALRQLEGALGGSPAIDRRLAYALHRLAFEGEIFAAEPSGPGSDPTTVARLRRVQEAVDRVLSGEDIRYQLDPPEPGGAP